jgi:acetyl-CoA synthetase
VFGGFSAEALRDRINDAQASVLVTADAGYRRGHAVPLERMADDALKGTPSIAHVVVVRRDVPREGSGASDPRKQWYHELMAKASAACEPEAMDAEDMLYILYTSGTTGKPKGIVHTTAGYLVGVYASTKSVFDLRDDDVYWCTADIGWVTGHSYVVYGPLANGATVLMYEGAPDFPQKDRFWELIERHGVTIFYTAPTAIRAFMRWGTDWPGHRDLSSLRLLGSVGEPINPEAWMWYYEHFGKRRCPVVETWWQTETGMIMITPLPGITSAKPGSAGQPFPGISAEVRSIEGQGLRMTRLPPKCGSRISLPSSSTIAASMPGSGFVHEPGFVVVAPGSGEIIAAPVSVCHQVSTIGHRSPPMTSRYHMYASGLIDSPTEPSSRSEERSALSGISLPHFMNVRIAVGAV